MDSPTYKGSTSFSEGVGSLWGFLITPDRLAKRPQSKTQRLSAITQKAK